MDGGFCVHSDRNHSTASTNFLNMMTSVTQLLLTLSDYVWISDYRMGLVSALVAFASDYVWITGYRMGLVSSLVAVAVSDTWYLQRMVVDWYR